MTGGDIGWAVEQLQAGERVRRDGWNGKGMFLMLVLTPPTSAFQVGDKAYGFLPYVQMKTVDEKVVPWLCSQTDLLSTDWEMV